MTTYTLKLATIVTALISSTAFAADGTALPPPIIHGSLDKEAIRPVILNHMAEVRHCYEVGLEKDPKLGGRLTVNFTIGEDGKVTESKAGQSTLKNAPVEKCIADVVHSWEFPKPKSGKVVVSYPFLLESRDK